MMRIRIDNWLAASRWWILWRLGPIFLLLSQPLAIAQVVIEAATPSAEVFVQTGNTLHTTMVRFSPEGQRLASCDAIGAVVGWDTQSGLQYREVHRHNGMCLGLAFSPDGQSVFSSGGARLGNEVTMSRWTDGQVVQNWTGHKGQVQGLVATPDGQGVWSLGDKDGLKLWRRDRADPVQAVSLQLPGDPLDSPPEARTLVMNQAQTTVWVGRSDGALLKVDLAGGSVVELARQAESLSSLALSPDGQVLAFAVGTVMGSKNQDVALLDAHTGRDVRRLPGHAGNVMALAFSPDGSLLASAAQIDTNAMLAGSIQAISRHEAVRVWRVPDGSLLGEERNQRNARGGTPFVRGQLDFVMLAAPPNDEPALRLAMALWDEAPRLYGVDPAKGVTLQRTLEGHGITPRQLRASDALNRLLVTDSRPRKASKETYLQAAQLRAEFGQPADWTPERVKRTDVLYDGRGMLTQVNKAAMWDLKTGRLDQMATWQRAPPTDLGLDAEGRFVSIAPMFPGTILLAPLRTFLLRQATLDAQGEVNLAHFGYEPWDGPLGELFRPMLHPGAVNDANATASVPSQNRSATGEVASEQLTAGSYRADVIVQSVRQRFTAVGAIPIGNKPGGPQLPHRVLVQERLAGGERVARYDIAVPGAVLTMAMSANEASLWISGTASGVAYDELHQAWLMVVDLSDGTIVRQWSLAKSITVDVLIAHPDGQMVITNGGTNLSIWDRRQDARRYFIEASANLRAIRPMALSADGTSLIASDTTGWTTFWRWPSDQAPQVQWRRQLQAPAPHLLSFVSGEQRIAAGASDGSVRLLARSSGDEIARMIRFDNDEWITIIPEGYFVASQDGDRFVNVRMDGKVYGIDQFYDVFYRPDIVERRLSGQPIAPLITVSLQDALRQPPPKTSLSFETAGPFQAGQKLRLKLDAVPLGGGVGELRLLHNGKLVEVLNRAVLRTGIARQPGDWSPTGPSPAAVGAQALGAQAGEVAVTRALRLALQSRPTEAQGQATALQAGGEVDVELVSGENSFSLIGFNGPGNLNARPTTRTITATGASLPPKVFVLALGVDIFRDTNSTPSLNFAVKDAGDFARAISARLGSTYSHSPVQVKLLLNDQATSAGLEQALSELQAQVHANDLLVWFVASHGTLDDNAQYGIVLQDWDGRTQEGSLFSTRRILEASRQIKAFNQLVILDTCHAGGVSSLVRGLYDARLAVLARNMGLHVFASASATEEAIDGYKGNGLFTHTLLQGLEAGLADRNGDKVVTVNELGDFARRETMRIARVLRHSQEPLLMNFGKDVSVYALPRP